MSDRLRRAVRRIRRSRAAGIAAVVVLVAALALMSREISSTSFQQNDSGSTVSPTDQGASHASAGADGGSRWKCDLPQQTTARDLLASLGPERVTSTDAADHGFLARQVAEVEGRGVENQTADDTRFHNQVIEWVGAVYAVQGSSAEQYMHRVDGLVGDEFWYSPGAKYVEQAAQAMRQRTCFSGAGVAQGVFDVTDAGADQRTATVGIAADPTLDPSTANPIGPQAAKYEQVLTLRRTGAGGWRVIGAAMPVEVVTNQAESTEETTQ